MCHDVQEDRGRRHYLWARGVGLAAGPLISFSTFPEAEKVLVVSVPIGWSYHTDPDYGVVLRNVYGEVLYPADVGRVAVRRERGFRLVEVQKVG